MKKIKLLFGFFVCFTMLPQTGLASASGNAQMTQMLNIATAGASGAYSAYNLSQCGGPGSFNHCIQGIMGALQMIQSLMGAANSGQTGSHLLNGDYGKFKFDPAKNGFCFDASTGCSPDAIDRQLVGLDSAFKTGEGYDTALEKMKADALANLKKYEDKGYKVNSIEGTITGPDGKTTTFADAAAQVPPSLGASASQKFGGVIDQIKEQDGAGGENSERGIASAKTSGAGAAGGTGATAFKDEYYGGEGSDSGKKGKKSKSSKKSLLASLTDKGVKKDAIGIAADDIFGMVNRRYIKKTKSEQFLKK